MIYFEKRNLFMLYMWQTRKFHSSFCVSASVSAQCVSYLMLFSVKLYLLIFHNRLYTIWLQPCSQNVSTGLYRQSLSLRYETKASLTLFSSGLLSRYWLNFSRVLRPFFNRKLIAQMVNSLKIAIFENFNDLSCSETN